MSSKRKIINPSLAMALATWRELDKSEESLREFEELVENLTEEELERRFLIRLSFGTAGLRGIMGPGYNCMNDVTVQQTAQGHCAYLVDRFGTEGKERGVFIGFDGRYNSENFAHLAAATFLSRGVKVRLSSRCIATPIVAYAVLKLPCTGGIVITASHNPKEYNGYKVFGDNGAQILCPLDSDISDWITRSLTLWKDVESLFNRQTRKLSAAGEKHPLLERLFDSIVDLYIQDIAADLAEKREQDIGGRAEEDESAGRGVGGEAGGASDLTGRTAAVAASDAEEEEKKPRVVYTALHGVGTIFIQRMLRAFRFPGRLILATAQCAPDPAFVTLDGRPNPEEKHALDLAIETANLHGATLVVANDPDADRFAAAERHAGTWMKFTGDELGVLLAAYAMELREMQGIPKENMAFVTSAVSSRMLEKMAKKNNCCFAETLTGFKWMEAKALELSATGYYPVLLYEEALGYGLSNSVRDKDGISAAAVFLQCAAALYAQGKQVHDMLLELRRLYGFFATQNSYFVCCNSSSVERFFRSLIHGGEAPAGGEAGAAMGKAGEAGSRKMAEENTEEERENEGGNEQEEKSSSSSREEERRRYPNSVGPYKITRVRDVARGYDSLELDNFCSLPPHEEMLSFYFDNGAVLTLRGSGTEPKLKYYAEACGSTLHQAREMVENVVEAFIEEFIKPKEDLFLDVPQ